MAHPSMCSLHLGVPSHTGEVEQRAHFPDELNQLSIGTEPSDKEIHFHPGLALDAESLS